MGLFEIPTLGLRVKGPLACFTRPELKAERMSYPVPTPSAARGILTAVLWKPAIAWHVRKIKVLSPIQFTGFRRNEVGAKIPAPSRGTIEQGGEFSDFFVEDSRQQRNTVALRDVDYLIEATFSMTEKAGAGDNPVKFVEMFRRRVERGQYFHHPYLGCREFVGDILPVDDETPPPVNDTRDLGLMLWDIEYSYDAKGKPRNRPIFFAARLEGGILNVPLNPDETLAAQGGGAA